MDIKELKDIALELMDALAAKKLGEVELELDNAKIKIKAAEPAPVIAAASVAAAAPAAAPAAASAAESADAAPAEEQLPAGTQVKSPLVGTFYSSPSPDEPPFVLVGQQVNEIKAPCDGKVIRIMAQPGDMVEYNQVLCVIE